MACVSGGNGCLSSQLDHTNRWREDHGDRRELRQTTIVPSEKRLFNFFKVKGHTGVLSLPGDSLCAPTDSFPPLFVSFSLSLFLSFFLSSLSSSSSLVATTATHLPTRLLSLWLDHDTTCEGLSLIFLLSRPPRLFLSSASSLLSFALSRVLGGQRDANSSLFSLLSFFLFFFLSSPLLLLPPRSRITLSLVLVSTFLFFFFPPSSAIRPAPTTKKLAAAKRETDSKFANASPFIGSGDTTWLPHRLPPLLPIGRFSHAGFRSRQRACSLRARSRSRACVLARLSGCVCTHTIVRVRE